MFTTKGQCYIIALSTLERIAIQFTPNEIAPQRTANYAEIQVVARNNPLQHFVSGSDTMTFELDFFANKENSQDVRERVNWLKALTRTQSRKQAPERIKLVFGDLFKDEVWIVNSVSPKFSLFDKENGFLPKQAYVSLALTLDPDSNIYAEDVRGRVDDGQLMTEGLFNQ